MIPEDQRKWPPSHLSRRDQISVLRIALVLQFALAHKPILQDIADCAGTAVANALIDNELVEGREQRRLKSDGDCWA
jgi:hypothetical protein